MHGYGPFEQPVDRASEIGRGTPRWVQVSLVVPFFIVLAWIVGESVGFSHPALAWAAVGALVIGGGIVGTSCLGHLASKLWRVGNRRRGSRPD